MKFTSIIAAGLLAAAASAQAQTTTLLNIVNPSTDPSGAYSLTFTATGTSVTLSDGGYNVPSWGHFYNNSVVQDGTSTNLLGQTWSLAPAAFGSDTYTSNDGTGVASLNFGGVNVGYYDVYSQTFATTAGDSYTYTFDFTRNGYNDAYFVTVSNAVSAVPESSSWMLMLAGLGLVAPALRRRKAQ